MLADDLKLQVERATVTIETNSRGTGRGFLSAGNLVLTAAHCIDFSLEGRMALGERYLQYIETSFGRVRLAPWAVEPVADVAILGEPDISEQAFQEEIARFWSFYEETTPLRLCAKEFELFQPIPIYVFTHEGVWVEGTAKQCAPDAHSLFVEFKGPIKGGTSGSAIVNDAGEVVALVSFTGGSTRNIDLQDAGVDYASLADDFAAPSGSAPRPHLALPAWAVREITSAQTE